MSLLLKGAHAIDPSAALDATVDVLIAEGAVAQVGEGLAAPEGARVIDCAGKVLVPGLTDVHVHFRDPGLEYKETILTGSQAAVHGGFTDVAPMANTKPVIDNGAAVSAIVEKGRAAACHIHPVGACTKGLKGVELAEMGDMAAAGAVAFSDDGKGIQNSGMMRRVMDYAKMFNKVVMAHEQDAGLVENGQVNEGDASTRLGLAGWPATGEEAMIARDIEILRLTGGRLHLQHVTTAHGIELVRQAKDEGLDITCEVTPHHLFLNEDDLTADYDTNLKMNPPLRTRADNEALIEALIDGVADVVATDHAPHAAHEKALEFEHAPFGTTGLETVLPLMLTNLVATGRLSWNRLVEVMALEPRRILGVDPVSVAVGSAADLTLIDPEAPLTVTPEYFKSKSANSAFLGQHLRGAASLTIVGGAIAWEA
ncbi:MAG: dihydroorotase [Coriobacteriales bacterium]|nr:dihydroorotase [Coriobacteriales bacterium]